MYTESYINAEQRGILKEMVIDKDNSLIQILNEYEESADSNKLYNDISNLSLLRNKNNIKIS
jgi:hypothetical protein